MQAIWKWFFRLVIGVGVLFLGATMLFVLTMSRAHVTQSDGWKAIDDATKSQTLSKTLPDSSTRFCFARSSVGLGGRFMAYAVDGIPEDLDSFAQAEFIAHWAKADFTLKPNSSSPFDAEYVAMLERAYSVNLDWLRKSVNATGSVYQFSNEDVSHKPRIFVDNANGILYFVMTD